MASAGGKKKTKWKAVDPGIITNTATRKTASWADESENDFDLHDSYGGRKTDVSKVVLPTAPRAARGAEMEASIPQDPPFQAYLSNLSYEVTEDDLAEFFADMKVKSVRLPKDDRGNTVRAKGFGYVEFEDRNSLIEALSMPDTTCKSRRMRIEVAEGDGGRGGRGGGMRDRNYGDPDRTTGDWRSGPRSEASDQPSDRDGYRSGGGMRRDYGSDRDRDRGGFRREGDSRDGFRDRGFRDDRRGFDDRERDRGGSGGGTWRRDAEPRDSAPSHDREERRGFDDRDKDRGGGGGGTWRRDAEPRDSAPSHDREERRGFDDRDRDRGGGGGGPWRRDAEPRDSAPSHDREERRGFDDRDRDRGGGGGGPWRRDAEPRDSAPSSDREERRGFEDRDRSGWRRDPEPRDSDPPPDRGEPKQRQRLNLQPRTKPVELNRGGDEAPPGDTAPVANAAAIFGGARPVDTAARERQIEERLNKQRDSQAPPLSSAALATAHDESRQEGEVEGSEPSTSAPILEPAPPPRENVWARRSQQSNSAEVR